MAVPTKISHTNVSAQDRRLLEGWKSFHANPFSPTPEQLAFLRAATKIDNREELEQHVVAVQQKALQVFPYPSIQKWQFIQTNIAKLPGFPKALKLVEKRPRALLLDIGCCFGSDARKAVLDGYPAEQIVASDLYPGFLQLGRELFRDDESTMPITFLPGDVFDRSFLSLPTLGSPISTTVTPLPEIRTLAELHGRVSAVHAALFFHLFSREQQEQLARLLAGLLVLEKGSVVFGHQMGAQVEGIGREHGKWAQTPQSWKVLWEGALQEVGWGGGVELECRLEEATEEYRSFGIGGHWLWWTVELV